ncbi:HlyD family efflux transporter periplasmic adaptor subunit [Chitinimonas sp.]|uniref:HlyD family secretion protein n=1 Tax=Chitinimonas sp. TaxID=1934313 RepID=UPI002F94DCB8
MTTPTTTPVQEQSNGKRKPLMLAVAGIFATGAVAYGVYWYSHGRYYVETDNAYVQGNVVQVTPQAAGTIISIAADDTDFVQAGQPLVVLDSADSQLALETAQAQLGQTVREVRTLFANNGSLQAAVTLRETDLAKARDDLQRRQALAGTGAVAAEEIQHAKDAVKVADANLAAAREQLAANKALIDHTTPKSHPNVQRAALKIKEAQLTLSRATVPAPVSGFIARRAAQPGQRVNIGAPLMAIVPLDQLWVDANFKESQLADMRIGQPVTLQADVYGSDVVYHGKVAGFAAGTGAAFSLLPAQNATGNWIKVVQRLPVRIALDPKEVTEHPLRVGLSMRAEVETHDRSGPLLATAKRATPVAETRVYDGLLKAADGKAAEALTNEAGQ